MLRDRVEELGLKWPEDHYLKIWERELDYGDRRVYHRRAMGAQLRAFRRVLVSNFGDFETALQKQNTTL